MCDSKYMQMQWPVNDEPLNTFRTLELLFPISKKELVLVLFQFPKTIVINFLLGMFQNLSFLFPSNLQNVSLFRSEMNRSFMKLARHCAVFTYLYYLANVILFNKSYFQIKINNFQRV